MNFTFLPKRVASNEHEDGTTFTIDRLWRRQKGRRTEVSHLLDRTYAYHSVRELQWYLAEKFGTPVSRLELDRA